MTKKRRSDYHSDVWHIYQVMHKSAVVGMYDRKGLIILLKYLMTTYPDQIQIVYYGVMPRILKHAGVEIPGLDAVTTHAMPDIDLNLTMTIKNNQTGMRFDIFYWDLNRTIINL